MAWKIAQFSCDNTAWRTPGLDRIRLHAPRLLWNQGDTPYTDAGYNLYGTNSPALTASSTQADADAKYRQYLAKPEMAALVALRALGMRHIWQPDDHEQPGDDWDHDYLNSRLGVTFTSQALVNATWALCRAAQDAVKLAFTECPVPNYAGNTQRPSGALQQAQDPPTANYGITYFIEDYDVDGKLLRQQIGPTAPAATGAYVRVIYPDCISYRSPVSAVDNSSKVMLGPQQMTWMRDGLQAAVAAAVPYVFISSTKKVFGSAGDNSDMWFAYQTERAGMLSMIGATGAKPIWASGDRHHLQTSRVTVAGGWPCDLTDICACPIGVLAVPISPAGEGLLWSSPRQGYALYTVEAGSVVAEMREANTGSVLWAARFAPGSNDPIYTDPLTAAYRIA